MKPETTSENTKTEPEYMTAMQVTIALVPGPFPGVTGMALQETCNVKGTREEAMCLFAIAKWLADRREEVDISDLENYSVFHVGMKDQEPDTPEDSE